MGQFSVHPLDEAEFLKEPSAFFPDISVSDHISIVLDANSDIHPRELGSESDVAKEMMELMEQKVQSCNDGLVPAEEVDLTVRRCQERYLYSKRLYKHHRDRRRRLRGR